MLPNGSEKAEDNETGRLVDKIVIDASVALKWQFKDEFETEAAMDMLSDFMNGKTELVSPALFAYEIVNALTIAVVRKRLPGKEGADAINDILSLGIKLIDFSGFEKLTFSLAQAYKRSAYDCAYLSLAEKEDSPLYTGDKRLFNALKEKTGRIKWIGNYVHA